MSKIIMHIDLNAFFATAEEINNPQYMNKPLIVGGTGRRGIVSTANYEARKYGIHSAMPTYMAKELCPQVIIVPGHFDLYHRLSNEFFNFVRSYSPIIEIASIDECYVDMTDCLKNVKNVERYLQELQNNLYQKTKLKCSIGISTTKFLAKMASDMKKPMGITILRKRDLKTKLYPLKIEDMFGIGKKTSPKLKALNINTIGDLLTADQTALKEVLGKFYYTCMDWISGRGSDVVETQEEDPKSIGNSRTFEHDTDDYEEISSMINKLSLEVSKRAIEEKKLGTTVSVTIKTLDFKNHSKSITSYPPFNSFDQIKNKALTALEELSSLFPIRLVGVTLSSLVSSSDVKIQMSLFDFQIHEDEARTRLLINDINRKFNKNVVKTLSEVKKVINK